MNVAKGLVPRCVTNLGGFAADFTGTPRLLLGFGNPCVHRWVRLPQIEPKATVLLLNLRDLRDECRCVITMRTGVQLKLCAQPVNDLEPAVAALKAATH